VFQPSQVYLISSLSLSIYFVHYTTKQTALWKPNEIFCRRMKSLLRRIKT